MNLSNVSGQPELGMSEDEALKLVAGLLEQIMAARKLGYSVKSTAVYIHRKTGTETAQPSVLHITVTR